MNFCPHCGGDLSAYMAVERGRVPLASTAKRPTGGKYDQDSVWRRLVREAEALKGSPPSGIQIVGKAVDNVRAAFVGDEPVSTIVHLALDRNIQPQGGMLYRATMLEGRMTTSPEQLEQMGYAVEDEKLVTVADVPVSQAYKVIDYWAGAKQHKRWHMTEPVSLNPSRNGNPFFMDENMVAFGAKWHDSSKLEEALLELHSLLSAGVKRAGVVAIPLALELAIQ